MDPNEVEDFRAMTGDDHFERSIVDAAVGHVEAAFRRALGSRLLKFNITGRGFIVWQPQWLSDEKKTVVTAKQQGVVRITAIRPVIDVPHDEGEDFDFLQDPSAIEMDGYARLAGSHPSPTPFIRTKVMKKWKRLTISFLDVYIPVQIFPWADVDTQACDCPECAITPRLYGVMPTFICAICGQRSWCSCMNGVVKKFQTRQGYSKTEITDLVASSRQREGVCHICRGVPVTSSLNREEKGLTGLMSRYWVYLHMAAIENDWNWKEAENSVRQRLGVPRIGEGWVGEAMLLYRVIALFPDEEVIHQGSPEWLGRQRFDIWMPDRKVAIEYHGEQHYSAVSVFGGAKGLERTQQRDEKKRLLCRENGVRLIEIPHYDTPDDGALSLIISARQ